MFYIYANGKSIYQPRNERLALFSPKLTVEMGKAGSLTFQIPPSNRYYNALDQLATIVTVEMDNVEIFRGRILSNSMAFNKVRTIYCEGNLAYLIDSVQKGIKYEGKAHDLFRGIIAAHNARVEASKRFVVGSMTIENRDILLAGKSDDIQDAETGEFDYNQIAINSVTDEWMTSLEYIETTLISNIGGYLRTRHQNGTTYIDLLSDYGTSAAQEIEFGKNLLDLTEEVSAEEVFTVLIPLGDENLTIETVNNGSDELVDNAAVARYGRIIKTHVFDSVTNASTLLENGRRYLANHVNVPVTITAKAVDMHLVDPSEQAILLGDQVRIKSQPHGMLDLLTCTKIEYDMADPANNTYTFGTPKQSLTERYRKDKTKPKSGGGASAGKAADESKKQLGEFYDAWIDPNPEGGTISLLALYEKYNNDRRVLKHNVGIDLDAPNNAINIENIREAIDETTGLVTNQTSRIDLLNNEMETKVALVATHVETLEEVQTAHYASLVVRADRNESAIEGKADKITFDAVAKAFEEEQEELQTLKDVLEETCGISMEATEQQYNVNIRTLKNNVDEQGATLDSYGTEITSISNSLRSQINLEAKHYSSLGDKVAKVELKASNNETSIRLKANKTYVDSEILTVTGKVDAVEAEIGTLKTDMAKIDLMITERLNAYVADVKYLEGKEINTLGLRTRTLEVRDSITLKGLAVATEEYVNRKAAGFATSEWVSSQDYATRSYVNSQNAWEDATETGKFWCRIGGKRKIVALGNHTHSSYVTEAKVRELINAAIIPWSHISDKPSSYYPSSHRHSFSTTVPNGHTHKVMVGSYTYTSQGTSTNGEHRISGNTGYTGG